MALTLFENFSDRAKRAVFFARWEAQQDATGAIEAEHLLLGLLREDPELFYLLADRKSAPVVRLAQIATRLAGKLPKAFPPRPPRDLPLSSRGKRAVIQGEWNRKKLGLAEVGTGVLLFSLADLNPTSERWFFGLLKTPRDPLASALELEGLGAAAIARRLEAGDITPQDRTITFARQFLGIVDRWMAEVHFTACNLQAVEPIEERSRELTRMSFVHLADLENLNGRHPFNGARSVRRVLSRADAGIVAHFQAVEAFPRPSARESTETLALLTEFSDGRWIETIKTSGVLMNDPPAIETVKVKNAVADAEVVSLHLDRIRTRLDDSPGCQVVPIRTREEYCSSIERVNRTVAASRASAGGILTLDEIARLVPSEDDAFHRAVLNEMKRQRQAAEGRA